MKSRISAEAAIMKDAFRAMTALKPIVRSSSLESSLTALVKVRASQINRCGHCVDMHTKDARLAGETEQRLHLLTVWEEASLYSERERAALAWTEALTRLHGTADPTPDALYDQVRQHFNEDELVALTMCIVEINGWNRIAISCRFPVGSYEPGSLARSASGGAA